MLRTNRDGLEYGGTAHNCYWEKKYNPNADIINGLADCTTYAYGRCLEEKKAVPVTHIGNAGEWHKWLSDGWIAIKYDKSKVRAGDIIEWENENHVAYVEQVSDNVYISGSFYTGMHGRSYWQGGYDPRSFTSLQEMSDWMIKNYEYRFFHYTTVETESSWCGGQPDWILRLDASVVTPVEQDETVTQIQVLTNEQNVRNNDNVILGRADAGFYNVLSKKESYGYIWYEVEPEKFIAGVSGRVIYIPSSQEAEIEKLRKENAELKAKLATVKAQLQDVINNI